MLNLLILLIGTSQAANDYFEYDDCGETCVIQRSCCTITEKNENFITTCCSSEECSARENNRVVCLCPGWAPAGGQDIWYNFRRLVHPTTTTDRPAPENQQVCDKWKIMLGTSWCIIGLVITFYLVKISVKRFRSRNDFERVISDDSPYQPTTESIDD